MVYISASPRDRLDADAPDIAQSLAFAALREVRQAWAARLPIEPEALLAYLLALPQADLLSLLAVCVASTIDVTTARDDVQPGVALAHSVDLDMHAWWTPTAASYFAQVSKAKTLEAMQTIAPEHVTRLGKLKKDALASEAERLAAGTGWLPSMLREPLSTPKAEEGEATP